MLRLPGLWNTVNRSAQQLCASLERSAYAGTGGENEAASRPLAVPKQQLCKKDL